MNIIKVELVRDNEHTEKTTKHATIEDAFIKINKYKRGYYRKDGALRFYEFRIYITFEGGFHHMAYVVIRNDAIEPLTDILDDIIHVADRQAHYDWNVFDRSTDEYFLDSAKKQAKFAKYLRAYKLAHPQQSSYNVV